MQIQRQPDDPAVWRLRLTPSPGQSQITLSAAGLQSLAAWIDKASQDAQCRILVLEGSQGRFCEGMDLSWVTSDISEQARTQGMQLYAETLLALRRAPLIVVGLVDGVVRAGGMGLAAATDFLFATEASEFGLPEVSLGLVPAMVMPFLCMRMPLQKAMRMTLACETLNAQEALQIGLLDQLVPDAAALSTLCRRTLRQLLRMNPDAVATCKRYCQQIVSMSQPDAVLFGAQTTGQMLLQDETIQGIQQFLAGEPVPWFARYQPPPKSPTPTDDGAPQ